MWWWLLAALVVLVPLAGLAGALLSAWRSVKALTAQVDAASERVTAASDGVAAGLVAARDRVDR